MADSTSGLEANNAIPDVRLRPSENNLLEGLGTLSSLPGTWIGTGFNMISRPHFGSPDTDFFLEINLTKEILRFDPITSPIPNRGLAQADINLFGLHYLQQISDRVTQGALHLEPGIWINVPKTSEPDEPATVARLASIPHGTTLVAQGQTIPPFAGPPTFNATTNAVNTIPFATIPPTTPSGATTFTPITFAEFDLDNPSPFRSPLPPTTEIDLATLKEALINPNVLLGKAIAGQKITNTVVLNIASSPSIPVVAAPPPAPQPAPAPLAPHATAAGGGGLSNIAFLNSVALTPPPATPPVLPLPNANVTDVFATFWIETVESPFGGTFLQLQYSQTVYLKFRGLTWPHVSVATLVRASL